MSRKLEHMTAQVQREVSHVIMYELADPRLGFVTITGLKLAPDQANATVFVSVLGDEATQDTTLEAIRHARGHIQKLLAERLKLRRVPLLVFKRDDGVKRSVRVSALLHDLAEERAARTGPEGETPPEESEESADGADEGEGEKAKEL